MAATTAHASSDIGDRTVSVLSTSSQTHVDSNNALPQSPPTKMTAGSPKQAQDSELTASSGLDQDMIPAPVIPTAQHIPDTAQVGRLTATASRRTDRPPPPACMQNCIASIESCTQDIVRFNERVEQNRVQAQARRRENGDPLVARKAMIPMVFIILSWVFVAFVWRVCSRLIQQNPPGIVLGTRSEGIGLLVGFVILWIMSIWSYVVVISKGPGLVKDYVAESDPPPAAAQAGWNGAPAAAQPYAQGSSEPIPIPGAPNGDAAAHVPASSLPYPSFNADLERFGGLRASSDSMRVLPGSVEPNFDHSVDAPHARTMSSSGPVERLTTEPPPPSDDVEATDPAADPALPGILGPLAAAALGGGQGVREGAEAFDQAPAAPAPHTDPSHPPPSSGWAPPQRRPQNDPPPLSPAALYCHRCRRIKPPRAHHCRRCGTCVLKMDHHCPWVGGCVGAHNQRFFFIFVLWVTLLELYTLVCTAVVFHRGVRSLGRPGSAWRVDGYLISLFPICAVFLIFTGALLGTHVWLISHNLTTIEHVGVNRMQGRERVLVDRWFATQAAGSGGKVGGLNLKQKRQMVRGWDREWGKLTSEGNRWWLGSPREAQWEKGSSEKQDAVRGRKSGAFRTNVEQALGESVWLWFLPLGKHPNDGLCFPMNPRFGEEGVWRKRDDWPAELR